MKNLSPLAAFAAALCLAAGSASAARAQERDAPKAEVGAHFTSLELNPPTFFGTSTEPGVGGRFAYNVTDYLGLEAEMNFLPQRSFFGRATQGQFGVKVGKRFRKFGVFAKARPGFVSFGEESSIVLVTGPGGLEIVESRRGRKTHLSVDVGGVLEFYPSRKFLVRVDAGDTMIRYKPETLPPNVGVFGFAPEGVSHNFQLTTGVAYRFMNPGGADEADTDAPEGGTPRFEAGIQYTALFVNQPAEILGFLVIADDNPTFTEPAVGGRFTFNLNDSFALEGAVDFMTKEHFSGPTYGGRGIQGQFGVKAGRRFERFGLFAKARPGFLTYSRVQRQTGTQTINFFGENIEVATFGTGRKTYFESDFGGVAEFYPTRRIVTRFDAGDTVVWYRDRVAPGSSLRNSILRQPDETKHNFQFSAGIGIRF